ncbi:TPA: transferrin-binding protein-like solute binding protein [Neisseria meningitidis]
MNNPLVNQAAMVLPVFLLSACLGGGGSFDLGSVETKQRNPPPEAPKYRDEQTEKPAKPDEAQAAENERSAYGFAAKIPRRNWYKNKEDHKALSEADWEKLGAGEPGEFRQKNEIFAMDEGTLNESITTGDGKSRVEGYTDFKYVRSGYIYRNGANKIDLKNDIALFGPDGYLFYKGSNPSQALPTGKAIYKGTWDYVTDAKGKQKFPQLGSPPAGDRYGALSAEEADVLRNESEAPKGQTDFGLTSEFEVDFAAKTMTGKLYRNNRITNNETENRDKQIKRYDIQASLHGNRFKGKALAADKNANEKEHPFVSDSNSLEGGFYGPQGDELGGKFLANDKKVLAVFSAKQKDDAKKPLAETFMDAYRIGADFVKEQIDSFGNVAKLLIDGVELSLLPSEGNKAAFQHGIEQNGVKATVCCSNLDYMSFGKLSKENKDDMFLQGVRTPVSDVAARTEANAKYRGTWYGYIVNGTSWSGEASNQESGNRAEFDVNFAKKTLNGMLTAKDRIDPAFTITATIQGNGFSGVAKTGGNGFALDPKNTIDPKRTKIHADVSGGFYGKNAIEMGGSFSGNTLEGESGKAAVVFGAKRQQLVQ